MEPQYILLGEIHNVVAASSKAFQKFRGGDPYHFDCFDNCGGEQVLRYWFWNGDRTRRNKKRVFLGEIPALLSYCLTIGVIRRTHFEDKCPKTHSDGGCGYCVIIRLLERLGVGISTDSQHWELTDLDFNRISHLLRRRG